MRKDESRTEADDEDHACDFGEYTALLALRTNKSDPIVGINEGVEEEMLKKGEAEWRWNGKYGVIQFANAIRESGR